MLEGAGNGSLGHSPQSDYRQSLIPSVLRRITAAGGWVSQEERVNDNLNLSRAIGDQEYKKVRRTPSGDCGGCVCYGCGDGGAVAVDAVAVAAVLLLRLLARCSCCCWCWRWCWRRCWCWCW